MVVGRRSFPIGVVHFQGRAVKLRGVIFNFQMPTWPHLRSIWCDQLITNDFQLMHWKWCWVHQLNPWQKITTKHIYIPLAHLSGCQNQELTSNNWGNKNTWDIHILWHTINSISHHHVDSSNTKIPTYPALVSLTPPTHLKRNTPPACGSASGNQVSSGQHVTWVPKI